MRTLADGEREEPSKKKTVTWFQKVKPKRDTKVMRPGKTAKDRSKRIRV